MPTASRHRRPHRPAAPTTPADVTIRTEMLVDDGSEPTEADVKWSTVVGDRPDVTRHAHDDELPLKPGMLYIDHCPPEGYVIAYAVDANGARCYEVRACLRRTTPELIDRWRDDARAIAAPALFLVRRETVGR